MKFRKYNIEYEKFSLRTCRFFVSNGSIFFIKWRKKLCQKLKLTTSYGEIVIELDKENAPITTENFLSYVESGFYNETVFHRVISGFMIQGGGHLADMTPKDDKVRPYFK